MFVKVSNLEGLTVQARKTFQIRSLISYIIQIYRKTGKNAIVFYAFFSKNAIFFLNERKKRIRKLLFRILFVLAFIMC